MHEKRFRENLVELLKGGQAHAASSDAIAGLSAADAKVRPAGFEHCVWEVLEHMRLAQEDILRYTLDEKWVSPPWPEGYWPKNPQDLTDTHWQTACAQFLGELDEVIALTLNAEIDLTAEIPHGEGRTYLREILLVADHNAYHTAQIVQIRKALGKWRN